MKTGSPKLLTRNFLETIPPSVYEIHLHHHVFSAVVFIPVLLTLILGPGFMRLNQMAARGRGGGTN